MFIRLIKSMLCLCLASIVMALIAYQSIPYFVSKYLNSCFHPYGNCQFNYEDFGIQSNQIVFTNANLGTDSNLWFSTHLLSIKPSWNWQEGSLDILITTQSPRIYLKTLPTPAWNNLKSLLKSGNQWLRINTTLKVLDGELKWKDLEDMQQTLLFDFVGSANKITFAQLNFNAKLDDAQNQLSLQQELSIDSKYTRWLMQCRHVEIANINKLMKLFGKSQLDIGISSGTLQGDVKIDLLLDKAPLIEGQLFVENLILDRPLNAAKCHLEHALLQFNKLIDAEKISTVCQLDLIKPAVIQHQILNEKHFIKHELSGSCVIISDQNLATIKGYGHSCLLEHILPWSLDGKVDISHNFLAEGTLFLEHQNDQSPLEITFYQTFQPHQNLKIFIPKLNAHSCNAFKEALAKHYPNFAIFEFKNDLENTYADFKLSIDGALDLHYGTDRLIIEHPSFSLTTPATDANNLEKVSGVVHLDSHNENFHNTLSLQDASYKCKKSNLLFYNSYGNVSITAEQLKIDSLETQCEGMYFEGQLVFDYSEQCHNCSELIITCQNATGKTAQLQRLLAHLDNVPDLKEIEIDGDIALGSEGMQLHFFFTPQNNLIKGYLNGVLMNGTILKHDSQIAFKGIDALFHYDHQEQNINITDLQCSVLVGKPYHVKDMWLTGHHLCISNLTHPNIEFDVSIQDQADEVMRLAGSVFTKMDNTQTIALDCNHSHIGCLYPEFWECRFKNWTDLVALECKSHFDLARLLAEETQRFGQTGLLCFSQSMIEKFRAHLPTFAHGSLHIHYQPSDRSYAFQIEGKHILQPDSSRHNALIIGRKQTQKWILDHLQWDDYHAYAEFSEDGDQWRIPFFGIDRRISSDIDRDIGHGTNQGIDYGSTLMIGLSALYSPQQYLLTSAIHLCKIDLSMLEEWFGNSFKPLRGIVEAEGQIDWHLGSAEKGLALDLKIIAPNVLCGKSTFHVKQPFQLSFNQTNGIVLQNIALQDSEGDFMTLKQLHLGSSTAQLECHEGRFSINQSHLKIIDELNLNLPCYLQELLAQLKLQNLLAGQLSFLQHKEKTSFKLYLEDGTYQFNGNDRLLKEIVLEMQDGRLLFCANSYCESYPYRVYGQSDWPYEKVTCSLFDGSNTAHPLKISLKNHVGLPLQFSSVQGQFSGCNVDLHADETNGQSGILSGKVTFDLQEALPICTPAIATTILKCQLQTLCSLQGTFKIHLGWYGADILERIIFKGILSCQNITLQGYCFDKFNAHCLYQPGFIELSNCTLSDLAGCLQIKYCKAWHDQQKQTWSFCIPFLSINNLYPAALQKTTESTTFNHSKYSSLKIKYLELHNLTGQLTALNTWEGSGELYFHNITRKTTHPLLTIPAEIILRVGLDPHVLNPVQGIIDFDLVDNRLYLTRFKDVYSDGRGSKFNLAQASPPSWIDLDGRLSVHIRMKQYNLIFKIIDLFTISIQGDYNKPVYVLQKQMRSSSKELSYLRKKSKNKISHPLLMH